MLLRAMRQSGIAALVIAYPLLAHYTNRSAQDSNLGAVVAIAPIILMGFLLAWHSPHRLAMMGILALLCAALSAAWTVLENHFALVYWLQHTGIMLVLMATFGRTLAAGRQPLCTRFAEALYGPVTPQHGAYTRRVTVAWTAFFAGIALTSTLLFFFAPLAIWSIFSNFLTLPLVALMFIAEFQVRKWVLPDRQKMYILDAVRAFISDSKSSRSD